MSLLYWVKYLTTSSTTVNYMLNVKSESAKYLQLSEKCRGVKRADKAESLIKWKVKFEYILQSVFLSSAVCFRALSAEALSAARSLRPRHEGFVPRAERQPAGRSEAAAAGQLLRPQTNKRWVSWDASSFTLLLESLLIQLYTSSAHQLLVTAAVEVMRSC